MNLDKVPLGDVTFDLVNRTLTDKDGHMVQLRHKSKEVLGFLIENPNRTVSKAELLETVWSDVTVSDESLVQCIAEIRRVIGENARQIIETVPRQGYRINLQTTRPTRRRSLALPLAAGVAALAAAWVFWPTSPAVQPSPAPTSQARLSAALPGTDVVEAYLEVLKGRVSADRFDSSESLIAERHFRRAIDLDPNYARAYAELGTLFAVRFENDWTVLRDADKEKALYFAEKAAALDPDLWLAHYSLGRLHSIIGNLEEAESHLERAMSLQPHNEDARAYFGILKNFQGDAEGAVAILEPALASHPDPPYWYFLGLGNALFNTGQYEQAATALNKCLELAQNSPYCLRYLIAVYGSMGLVAEAEAASRDYASMGFDPSVGSIMNLMTFHNSDHRDKLEKAFRSVGLPER